MNVQFYKQLLSALKKGMPVCLVTVTATKGSTPRKTGAKMLVFPDGRTIGTIGGSLVEKQTTQKAIEAIKTRTPLVETFTLTKENQNKTGMICGGEMTVFLEPIGEARNLYIFGAGHCGHALARAADAVGFLVHILDDRPDVASSERFPMAASITVGDYDEISSTMQPMPDAYIAIMTAAHAGDAVVLKNTITKTYRYIGMMASARKRAQIYAKLSEQGIDRSLLEKVRAPIGLDINAETPEEIAVSIAAELVKTARGAEREETKRRKS